jgi:hypothetical protein
MASNLSILDFLQARITKIESDISTRLETSSSPYRQPVNYYQSGSFVFDRGLFSDAFKSIIDEHHRSKIFDKVY